MATTIIKDTKDITFVGSPQYVTAKDVYAPAKADNFFIFLKIWHGDKTSIPVDNTIELFLPAEYIGLGDSGYETKVTFEVSKFIESYINTDEYIPTSGTIPYNGTGAVWYNYKISATGTGGGNTPITSDTKLATSGRGLTSEGSNPGTTVSDENDKIFGNHSTKLIADVNGKYIIPVYVGDTSANTALVANNTLLDLDTYLGVTLNSIDSAEQIAYVFLDKFILSAEWSEGAKIDLSIVSGGSSVLKGISFNGIDSYMDLGKVPLLNSSDSYVKLNFKATDWLNSNPFGYALSGDDRFQAYKRATDEIYGLQSSVSTTVSPSEYPTPNNYQEFLVLENSPPQPILATLDLVIGGLLIDSMEDKDYLRRTESGIPFYLGARNFLGSASDFTEVIFTSAEFFNGTTLKIFNAANNWNGATNYGGEDVVSYDDGVTWQSPNENSYCLLIECSKGDPMVLKFINLNGVLNTLPVNGINKQTLEVEKTNYQNYLLDSDFNYDPLSHMDKTFTSNGKAKFTVGTGWMYEESNQMIKELLVSKLVWLETSEGNYPVQIDNKSIQLINRTWTKQFDYSFNVTVANDLINDIA